MDDKYGLVPPVIAHNYEREEMIDRQIEAAAALTAALQGIDHRLFCEFITDRADPNYGVKPGRWHVVRRNDPPAPDFYMPITDENGGYIEPHFGIIDELHLRDTWKHGIEDYVKPKTKGSDLGREQMHDMAKEDVRAMARVSDSGLEKKAWGRGGKKRA